MADSVATMIDMPEFAPGAEIVIHTDDEDAETEPHLDGGPAVSETETDEAACGGSTRTVRHRRDKTGTWGVAMTWGRKRRLPTRSLLRALLNETADAGTPAAVAPDTCTPTTSASGATAAPPTRTT